MNVADDPLGAVGGQAGATSTTVATGGHAGDGGQGAGGGSPCPVDCATLPAEPCFEGICNEQIGQCQLVALPNGSLCEDGVFCTAGDECIGGICVPGPENRCGIEPGPCELVLCDEQAQACTVEDVSPGSPCTPLDLCEQDGTCTDGACIGVPKDCSLDPVPNECHVSLCNPDNGHCQPVPGNEGAPCDDEDDRCLLDGTCSSGVCVDTVAVDCSAFTYDCVVGACNALSGLCEQGPAPLGTACDAPTGVCEQAVCNSSATCITQPVPDGESCSTDACVASQSCTGGSCLGGTPILTCVSGDGCCPSGCDTTNDDDCNCHWALISQETQFASSPEIQQLMTDMSCTYDIYSNNGTGGVHTSNATLIGGYDRIILHKRDRLLSQQEGDILTSFVEGGGRLLVTGYDSLGSPTDPILAGVVNCLNPGDGPFSSELRVVHGSHPIVLGPAQTFVLDQILTASTTDHDQCAPGPGAVQLLTVANTSSKLLITENVGAGQGKVVYWNGNGSTSSTMHDWTGLSGGSQPALQNLLRNVLTHLCH